MEKLIAFLEENGVEYWLSGSKNVSRGWIGIQCVFCDDHSNHLGINLQGGRFHCWLCGERGRLEELLAKLGNLSLHDARQLAARFRDGASEDPGLPTARPPSLRAGESLALPKEFSTKLPSRYLDYLRVKRRFDPAALVRQYRLMAAGPMGRYRFRIIIPFFLNGRMITFTGLDITGKQTPKYKDCPMEESLCSPKLTLYNIDRARSRAVIVEGVTDVWRIGDGAVALGTKTFQPEQIQLLLEKEVRKIMVMLDSDAIDTEGMRLANFLSGIARVELCALDEGDPDDLSESELSLVRKFLKG